MGLWFERNYHLVSVCTLCHWQVVMFTDHGVNSLSSGLTLILAGISYYIHYKMWDEITYPFLNFNGATVEV